MRAIVAFLFLTMLGGCVTTNRDMDTTGNSTLPISLILVENQLKKDIEAKGLAYVDNSSAIALISSVSNNLGQFISDGSYMNFEPYIKGLGFSKAYFFKEDRTAIATVYSYNFLIPNISEGVSSFGVKKAYEITLAEIKNLEGKRYIGIKKIEERDITIKGIKKSLIFKKYSFSAKNTEIDKDVISNVFITGHFNTLLKVRFTYPMLDKEKGEIIMSEFMSDLVINLVDFNGKLSEYNNYKKSKNY